MSVVKLKDDHKRFNRFGFAEKVEIFQKNNSQLTIVIKTVSMIHPLTALTALLALNFGFAAPIPTAAPTPLPSSQPSAQPSSSPTSQPSVSPTGQPSTQPSVEPSKQPFAKPSTQPS